MPHPLEYLEQDSPPPSPQPVASTSSLSTASTTLNSSAASSSSHRPARPLPSAAVQTYAPINEVTNRSQLLANRLERLRIKKMEGRTREWRERGVDSLGSFCLEVIRQNASRIWDIGAIHYSQVESFISDLPMAQLAEIELNSPHIRKDSDWLWEVFLIQDYPLYYEKCDEKNGELRTSGWRRMYAKAKEDTSNRRSSAADKIAQRYRELDEERNSRKIVVMEKLQSVAMTKRRGTPSTGGSSRSSTGTGKLSVIAKARQEAQRTRTSMLHASGHYKLPPPIKSRAAVSHDPEAIFRVRGPSPGARVGLAPYASISGPRIPAPRSMIRVGKERVSSGSERGTLSTSAIASNPTSSHNLVNRSHPSSQANQNSTSATTKPEKFRIPSSTHSKAIIPIQKPIVENFVAPKEKRKFLDFFDIPTPTSGSVKRSKGGGIDDQRGETRVGSESRTKETDVASHGRHTMPERHGNTTSPIPKSSSGTSITQIPQSNTKSGSIPRQPSSDSTSDPSLNPNPNPSSIPNLRSSQVIDLSSSPPPPTPNPSRLGITKKPESQLEQRARLAAVVFRKKRK